MTRTTVTPRISGNGPRKLVAASGIFWALLAAQSALAATFTVTSTADTNVPGTLRFAINQANVVGGSNIIDFAITGTIVLTSSLPSIASDLQITGPGESLLSISGAGNHRILFIDSGNVIIRDLRLTNGKAGGGGGGNCRQGGGAGGAAGMGAAIFVNAGTVEISSVTFNANNAIGGNGGNGFAGGSSSDSGAGGGGIGGFGGESSLSGPTGSNGGNGGALGGAGGTGGTNASGQAGGAGAGGGGGGWTGTGGAGGFAGGGGGGPFNGSGGAGGYGGGGGGGGAQSGVGGVGGTFGGTGGTAAAASFGGGGGGGAGMGGALFARAGATTLRNCTLTTNSATNGSGGFASNPSYYGTAGQGKGGAIFILTGATVYAAGLTFTGNSASDDAGSAGDDNDVYGTLLPAFPQVSSIVRVDATPTNAASVHFTVTFSDTVTGVDPTDFALTTTGTISGAAVSTVIGSGASYAVTVTTGPGDGTIRLDVTDNDSIVATAGPLGGPGAGNGDFTAGQLYTMDKTAPTAALSSVTANPTNGVVAVTVVLSESSVDFDNDSITNTNAFSNSFTGSGVNYTYNLIALSDGTITTTVLAGAFTDAVGNLNTASNTLTRTFDQSGPAILLSSTTGPTTNGAITVTAELSETTTNFAAGDVVATNAAVSLFAGSGDTYTFTLTPAVPGAFSASVAAASFTDAAGNGNDISNTLSRTFDITVPTAALSSTAADPINAAINVTVQLSEDSADFTAGDITATNGAVSGFAGSGDGYTFTLTPTEDGTVSASVAAGAFTDSAGNLSLVSNTLSRQYDGAQPTVTLSSSTPPYVTGAITVTVAASENVGTYAAGNVALVNAVLSGFAGSGDAYSFTLTPTGQGVFSVTFGVGSLTDGAGNASLASNTLERTLDTSAPGVLSIVPSTTGPTNALFVQFTVTFDGAVSDFDDETDVTVTHSGTASTGVNFTAVSDSVYTVEVTEISGAGSFTLSVNAGAAVDAAGNANPAFGPSPAVTMAQQTDLAIAAQASSASIVAGDPVTYTITITNNGPLVATNTVFSGSLPAGLTFVSATSTLGTVTHDGGTLTGGLGTMAVNDSVVITVVTVSSAGAIGELFVGTSVTTDEADSNTANNSAVAAVTVTAVQPNDNGNTNTNEDPDPIEPADIRVTIDFEQGDVKVGDAIPFHVTVLNAGGAAAEDVVLTFPIPEGTEFVSARLLGQDERFYKAPQAGSDLELLVTDETVTIQLPSVDAGESAQLEVVFRALTAGEIKLDAFASSTQFPVPVSIQTVAAITAQDEDCVSGDCVNNCGQCGAMGITPLLLTLNLAGIKWRMRRTRELRNRMA